VVWVLETAQVVVSGVVATDFVAVVGCDVVVAVGGPGRETRGSGVCRGAVGRLGSVYRRLRDAGGSFEVGGKVVVVTLAVLMEAVRTSSTVTWQRTQLLLVAQRG
jgi:hypothetical protein